MKFKMINVHVVITGLMATDNPYPGLGIARCLRSATEFRGTISGFVFDPLSTGAFCAGVFDRIFLIPYPAAGVDVLLQRIKEINDVYPIDLIIPSLDSEVILYAQAAGELAKMGIKTLLPSAGSIKRRSKNQLYEFCRQHKFRCPETIIINNVKEISARCNDLGGTPFVLKGALSDAAVCNSIEEGEYNYWQLFNQWGYPIMMQRFITGEEIDVIALTGKNSQLIGAVVMKKFGLTEKGKAFAGITVEDDKPIKLTGAILKRLEWIGPAECEFLKDEKGHYHLMEINSRFPSWLYLACAAGQNLPLWTLKLALDMPVSPLISYATGKLFVRTVTDSFIDAPTLLKLIASGEMRL
ncbi:MAG: ATP-grasp domain-containing protein [Smithellaceae bacterium]